MTVWQSGLPLGGEETKCHELRLISWCVRHKSVLADSISHDFLFFVHSNSPLLHAVDPCDAKNDWKQYSKTLHSYSFCCCDCSSHYYLYSCSSHIGILTPTPVIIATTILILIPILICSNLIPLSPLPCTPLPSLCPFTSNPCTFISTLYNSISLLSTITNLSTPVLLPPS